MQRLTLPARLADLEDLAATNRRLRERAVILDWSGVTEASPEALRVLLAGVSLDEHGDELGLETVPETLSAAIEEAASRPGRKATKKATEPAPEGAAPAVWTAGDDPEGGTDLRGPDDWARLRSRRGPTAASVPTPVATGSLAREHLLGALEADLIGPVEPPAPDGTPAEDVLPLPPRRWYLTGFLAPAAARDSDDATSEEEAGAGDDETSDDAGSQEPEPKQKKRFPASMGMSVFVPAGASTVAARVTFAEYVREARAIEGRKSKAWVWRRLARDPISVAVPLDAKVLAEGVRLPSTSGIWLRGKIEPVHDAVTHGFVPGVCALSLFLVNERPEGERAKRDEQCIFQVGMELSCEQGFERRPNRRDEGSTDWDDRVADLQFRDRFEYAVGHNVAVTVPSGQERVCRLRTTWLPRAEVRRVVPTDISALTIDMEALSKMSAAEVQAALGGLPDAYAKWIEEQRTIDVGTSRRTETRDRLMKNADEARTRVAAGIALLAHDVEVLRAFQLANQAMAQAALQRSPERYTDGKRPEWRLFQLAFVLLSLRGVADERHGDRENVELIFFPTGSGKTEAYLGVIAFDLVLRRLRGQARPDGGLGVAILLRYTLRLLTLDQLGRAATLICALEKIRQADPARLGAVRFAIGLWVGRTATANTLKEVASKVTDYKNGRAASPFPLPDCPWCRKQLTPFSLTLEDKKSAVVVACADFNCDFARGKNRDGLPVIFVDEQVYRELPSFIIATVDKFAMMPWRGEAGMLFGRARWRDGRGFFGPLDKKPPKGAQHLPTGLLPPDLIVQDELHLISGPLGTMVGLYETAIEALCSRQVEGAVIRPKILASTATVRRAQSQVKALFGRDQMALFPPPGVNEGDTFFARMDRESPGRVYVGVAAPGRSLRSILLRVHVDLLTAANKLYDEKAPPDQVADAYMTVAGYYNSLRELGAMRRLVEDDVRTRCEKIEDRVPFDAGPNRWFRNRGVQPEPIELTSRESTSKIAASKARLARHYSDKHRVDVLLASNMISVGVDIDRLGLMVVAGQPKSTSEYIQASSRVGRQLKWPGLVVTCFNVAKPRDRSHYERFTHYHDSFYRFVEAQSLTPFSGPALQRGLTGTLVAMTRLSEDGMTPPEAAMRIAEVRTMAERMVEELAERGARQAQGAGGYQRAKKALLARGKSLLDAWETVIVETRKSASERSYSKFDREAAAPHLLFTALDEPKPSEGTDGAKFQAPTSMRDVEPSVHLWLERGKLGGRR